MNKKILLPFLFSFSLSYAEEVYKLIVIPQKDYKTTIESLKNYGFNKCFLDNKKIICAESKDPAYIQRLKDYLSQYGFNVKIEIGKTSVSQNENLASTINESVKMQIKESKVNQELKNKQVKEESYKQEEKIQSTEKDLGLKVKLMYGFLNVGNLKKAKELANQLLKTKFSKDAKYVIGLIDIKEKKI
jgi:hypothetical protein